jgi:hypothetical protein
MLLAVRVLQTSNPVFGSLSLFAQKRRFVMSGQMLTRM